ncbi:uncharacterized protein LOC143287386 [Babylonia areolata]|uniref:uncharacterized protein LOC143287386 n=1 Tax=Babylonia areolata TaxID=304850 RepID=UPI003FD4DA7F
MKLLLSSVLLAMSLTSAQMSPTSSPKHGVEGEGQGESKGQGEGQGRPDALALRCQKEKGTLPYWLDPTCRSYLVCTGFSLTLERCPQGGVYSYFDSSCIAAGQVDCSAQNEEFSALVRDFLEPQLDFDLPRSGFPALPMPLSATNTNDNDNNDDDEDDSSAAHSASTASKLTSTSANSIDTDDLEQRLEEGGEEGVIIDLDDLPSITVDSSNSLNVTLDRDTCERLDSHVTDLQTSLNMALLVLTGCPERSCDVTLFRLLC